MRLAQKLISLVATVTLLIATSEFAIDIKASHAADAAQRRSASVSVPARVLAGVQAGRTVRIIVGVRTQSAFVPEGRLGPANRRVQREGIALGQQSLLKAVQNRAVNGVKHFAVIPALSLEVDAAALAILAARPEVSYIEEDGLLDPALWESRYITGAATAWDNGYGGLGTTIAILDSGVDRFHPYFSHDRVVSEACYSTTSLADGSTALCTPGSTEPGAGAPCTNISGCDHGGQVATIAAALEDPTTTYFPLRGVAPGASIIAIQVYSRFYGLPYCIPDGKIPRPCIKAFTSDVIAGLERVYELRDSYSIAAVNLSLGGRAYTTQAACDLDSPSLAAIIGTLRSADIATVAAAGNNGLADALSAPACISGAISVGSTTDGTYDTYAWPADLVSAFSNSASFLSLLAPGELIQFVQSGEQMRGTSMAAPHVTGAWALLRSRFTSAPVEDILNALINTGTAITDPRNGITKPRINIAEAIATMGPPCTYAIAPAEILVGRGGGTTTVTVTTGAGCPWTVFRHESYVQAAFPAAGVGSGTLNVTVAPNPWTDSRRTALDVVHVPVTVYQAGVPASRLPVDVNADGHVDLIWQHDGDGRIAAWVMSGTTLVDGHLLSPPQVPDTSWKIVGAGDLDADGFDDLVWQNVADGRVSAWFMNGTTLRDGSLLAIPQVSDLEWHIRAVADMNGDGRADLWWQHGATGQLALWLMDGVNVTAGMPLALPLVTDLDWEIAGAADFDGDRNQDLVWHHRGDGRIAIWRMNGAMLVEETAPTPGQVADHDWTIRGVADLNGDGKSDLIWQNTADGRVSVWLMDGLNLMDGRLLNPPQVADTNWRIVAPR